MSDYIGPELLASILKRLPVKTLLRCRCVCNSWKQLIASNWFVLDHLAVQRPYLIAQNDRRDFALLDPRALPSFRSLTSSIDQFCGHTKRQFLVVVGGVHGVICLFNNYDECIFLWNPLLHRSFRISVPGTWICDLTDICGFWIDPSNNDFKIVVFRLGHYRWALLFSSMKLPAWTEVDTSCMRGYYISDFDNQQVLIGGVAHWVIYNAQPLSKAILFFDFGQEEFGKFEFPERVRVSPLSDGFSRDGFNICKWKESLSVVHWKQGLESKNDALTGCDLWTMQNGSWRKMFSFNLMNEVWIWKVHTVLDDSGRLLVSGKHPDTNIELLYYDPKHGCTPITSNDWGYITSLAFDCVESLVFQIQCVFLLFSWIMHFSTK